jgi:hypothetical protein
MKRILRPRQFSLLQLVLTITVVAAYCGLIRYLLVSGQGENILRWTDYALTLVIGGMMTAVGFWSLYHAIRQILVWPKTKAVVLRYCIRRSENKPSGQPFYHPVLRFDTQDARSITTISSWGSWRRVWPQGATIVIRYNPTNPKWAEIATFVNIWVMPLTFLILGMGPLLALLWPR